jgi:hypothetical protein
MTVVYVRFTLRPKRFVELDHVCTFRPREHLRRELRIDQNDIGADCFGSPYTFVDQRVGFRMFVASEDGVGPELPEHQVGTHPRMAWATTVNNRTMTPTARFATSKVIGQRG